MKKLLLFFFICSCPLFSQSDDHKEAYVLFDAIVGQKNLELNVGVKYIEKYRTQKDEHQFYNNKFSLGDIKYNGQIYYNVPLVYDMYNDQLIIRTNSLFNNYPLILDKNKVDFFILFHYKSYKFVNLKNIGYSQILQKNNNFTLYKVNRKKVKSIVVTYERFSKFIDINSFQILKNGKLLNVTKKKDWIKAYPSLKSSIQLFYKSNKKLLKSNPDSFMINLFNTLNKS